MRLLNARTLQFEGFLDDKIPVYAILSHRWTDSDEVLYRDLELGKSEIALRSGYQKIKATCQRAIEDGISYAWVDTCCIDKSSSAELSEAINSMYRWYGSAAVCYAYLYDVPIATAFRGTAKSFEKSRWFTRGWTLQELLAPTDLVFYSAEWKRMGTKKSLAAEINSITGIDRDILEGMRSVRTCSIARIMQMASERATSRREDIAYCLMGLFDVNMPMLYGEGDKAFIRLQEEILKRSDDHTVFAWADENCYAYSEHGMLARHPMHFRNSGDFVPYHPENIDASLITLTNAGLSFKVNVLNYRRGTFLEAAINCAKFGRADLVAYIHLKCLDPIRWQFCRIDAGYLGVTSASGHSKLVYVRQNPAGWAPKKLLQRWLSLVAPSDADGWMKIEEWHVNSNSKAYLTDVDGSRRELVKREFGNAGRMPVYHGRDMLFNSTLMVPPQPRTMIVGFRLHNVRSVKGFGDRLLFGTSVNGDIGVFFEAARTLVPISADFKPCPILLSVSQGRFLYVKCVTVVFEEEQRIKAHIEVLSRGEAFRIPLAEGGLTGESKVAYHKKDWMIE